MTATAHLRVYVPAFEASDDLLALPEAVLPAPTTWRLGEFGLVAESMTDDVLVVEYDSEPYLCPRHPRLRMLESVLAFHNGFTGLGGDVIVPETTAIRAADELEYLRNRDGARSHILTSQWHIPLRWFLLFEPSQRVIADADGRLSVRYLSDRRETTRRMRRAIRALRAAGMEMVTVEMEQLLDWLLEFPPGWLVELDYGTVAGLFDPVELRSDSSCGDLWESIEALENGDPGEAHRWYETVASRWADAMLITYAN